MQADDFTRFRAVLAGLSKVYERELDGPLLDAYWLALRDWPLAEFEQAAGHLLAHSRFMPRPTDFTDLRKAGRMTAGEAWAAALQHARGAWRAGPAVPEVERAVQAIGGWPVIAGAYADSLQFLERRFVDAFRELEQRVEIREQLPAIAGPSSTWRGRVTGPAKVAELLPTIRRPA
jgi:hypothetical protein